MAQLESAPALPENSNGDGLEDVVEDAAEGESEIMDTSTIAPGTPSWIGDAAEGESEPFSVHSLKNNEDLDLKHAKSENQHFTPCVFRNI